jgi:aryl-alcohol dehydrogenase-like predicted oxidoreductase
VHDALSTGAMGICHGYTGAGRDDTESIRTIHCALDLGVTLIDTAEIYGLYVTRSSSARPSGAGATGTSTEGGIGRMPLRLPGSLPGRV